MALGMITYSLKATKYNSFEENAYTVYYAAMH